MSRNKTANARVEEIVKLARKYRRSIHAWHCAFDAERQAFVYTIVVARERSGTRGGPLVARQEYTLLNLDPAQRKRLVLGIGCEAGVRIRSDI